MKNLLSIVSLFGTIPPILADPVELYVDRNSSYRISKLLGADCREKGSKPTASGKETTQVALYLRNIWCLGWLEPVVQHDQVSL
ncbi:hypothetical protein Lmac_3061 [Legionella maceachernii]|uniref:Uncharacterized protein n=1 Tax=Legionella maceachernii TaxID=466 RepID=A0A0W0VVN7_9GAMM|nr:hypothetical protein Lmac_3061 [Legionella maceachernii]SJZ88704.1 hypothetical protein SAMN02745128_01357 [Legionella maceachernii]SUO98797.1 Uncharacterised protein [Legionella maceachernii]